MLFGKHALQNPYRSLAVVFVAWKVFLLAVALAGGISPPYDTSASLLSSPSIFNDSLPLPRQSLVTRLTSWDAIYFVQIARRGYLFEQEWAFGPGLPTLVSLLAKGLRAVGLGQEIVLEAVLGVAVAHTSHLTSVLVLYELGVTVCADRQRAFLAATLHILSPAGIFLSAPYTESPFSLLSFVGILCFAKSCLKARQPASRDALLLLAGLLLGLATSFRSNGILNGIPFAFELVQELSSFLRGPSLAAARKLTILGLGGFLVACGSLIPQSLAYLRYCSGQSGPDVRPWCAGTIPSIYHFVQQHYWNTGFLRYWTLSNAPLFLLAGPMIFVLTRSGLETVSVSAMQLPKGLDSRSPEVRQLTALVRSIGMTQLILTLLAVTSYHVQIITRLSSGYPAWYWWLAGNITDGRSTDGKSVVYFMVMYASIQAALFACFLPPA